MLAGAAWPKEKLAPTAGAGADVSAGLAEKLNDGVGPVDPVEEAAVEVLVAEKEKAPDPDDVEGAVDDVACPKENDGADEELEVVEAPALKLNAGDLSVLAPPNEKAAELSDLEVACSETDFAAPRE